RRVVRDLLSFELLDVAATAPGWATPTWTPAVAEGGTAAGPSGPAGPSGSARAAPGGAGGWTDRSGVRHLDRVEPTGRDREEAELAYPTRTAADVAVPAAEGWA